MLHLLYGSINSATQRQKKEYIEALFREKNKQVDLTESASLFSFSKYKPLVQFADENYIFSSIGQIYFHNSQKKLSTIDIINLFKQYGKKCLSMLSGHFCLSLIDKNKNSCLIANDIMATLPMYYHLTPNNEFLFSSKLKVLANTPGIDTKNDPQAFYNYIYFHMIPSPGTVYQNIKKLQPAEYVFFNGSEIVRETYWEPEFTEKTSKTEQELSDDIFETLLSSTRYYSENYKTFGSFLSGGLDSSAVSGMLAKIYGNGIKTFSIGFPVETYNEIGYARLAAATFNTEHVEYFIQPDDVIRNLNLIIDYLDEPFGNSSIIPTFYCAKLAHENNVSTLLAGDGGDELFAGNTRYAKQQIFEQYFKIPNIFRKTLIEPLLSLNFLTSNYIGRKAKRYVEQANIPLPERLETYNFLFIHSPNEVFESDFIEQIDRGVPLALIEATYKKPQNATYLNKMLYLDWKHTLADNDLRKVNMMCELAGINVEYPMLSNEMINLANRIPSNLKLTPHKLRYLYKKSMQGFLPKKIINKPKHGFGLPFGVWTQTEKQLQEMAYDTINSLEKHAIFQTSFLKKAISNHQQEDAAFYGELVWILMILGLWLEQH